MSPGELLGKYTLALGRIGGSDGSNRRKPIYERNSQNAERRAIAEAANALSRLWKLKRSSKA